MTRGRSGKNLVSVLRSRFGRRLLAAFVGAALLPVLLLSVLSIRSVTERLREQADRDLRVATKEMGMALAERLIHFEFDLDVATLMLQEMVEPHATHLPPSLARRLERQFDTVITLDEDGRTTSLLTNDLEPHTNILPPDRESEAKRAHVDSGKTWIDNADGKVRLTRRFGDGGRLTAIVRGEALWQITGVRPVSGQLAVLDHHGKLLHRSDSRLDVETARVLATGQGAVTWTTEYPDTQESVTRMGRVWQLFLVPRFGLSWKLLHARPQPMVLAPLVGARRLLVGTSVLTLLLVSLISLYHSRRVLGPILTLQRGTKAVGDGNLDVRVQLDGRDEIAALGDSFDLMVQDLRREKTRRTKVENELRVARDEALESIRVQSAFLTNVSHEFRTPVTGILASAEVLRDFGSEDPDACREFSEAIHDQAVHLTHLVEDALALSGGDEIGFQMSISPVPIEGPLRAAITTENIEDRVRLAIDDDLPDVLGDSRQLTRLWSRLLDNAVKFSPESSPIDVRVSFAGERIAVRIQDHGPGIADEHHEAIFERFVQVGRDQRTEKAPGVGVGLSLARRIVDGHGGSIRVESRLGDGACFIVELPAAPVRTPA